MTTDDNKSVLVCLRVADTEPKTQSVVINCDDCSAPIWISNSSPETDLRICIKCVTIRAKALAEAVIKLEPPTDKQIDDIEAYRELKGRP
jgi:hypothetical protein